MIGVLKTLPNFDGIIINHTSQFKQFHVVIAFVQIQVAKGVAIWTLFKCIGLILRIFELKNLKSSYKMNKWLILREKLLIGVLFLCLSFIHINLAEISIKKTNFPLIVMNYHYGIRFQASWVVKNMGYIQGWQDSTGVRLFWSPEVGLSAFGLPESCQPWSKQNQWFQFQCLFNLYFPSTVRNWNILIFWFERYRNCEKTGKLLTCSVFHL